MLLNSVGEPRSASFHTANRTVHTTPRFEESTTAQLTVLRNIRGVRSVNGDPAVMRRRGDVSSLQWLCASTIGRALAKARINDPVALRRFIDEKVPDVLSPFLHGALTLPGAPGAAGATELRSILASPFLDAAMNLRSISAAFNIRGTEMRDLEAQYADTVGAERVRKGESCLDVSRKLGIHGKAKYALQLLALREFGWKHVLAGRHYTDVARELGVDGNALEKLKLMVAETLGRTAILNGATHEAVVQKFGFEQWSNAWKRLREISLDPTSDRYALQKELRKEFAIGDA